jgi:JmjC domain, hydroxylase/Zinc-finger domain of monoamine-oxidase A repressor R1
MLTDQINAQNFTEPTCQRIYLKDIDCPDVWFEKLEEIIPSFLFYMNETTTDPDAANAFPGLNTHDPSFQVSQDVAKAGDLMSSLPSTMRAENLMCYIGHEGTFTPCHQEMCATLGHNIMVESSTGLSEYGKRTKPGSSIWFMTETKDHHLVSEYWSSVLGHDIDLEDHFAQISAWKAAPFKTYVVEQKVGDFILIPPLAPHQVWNRGTRTMKVAWNRTTVETLELALEEALPRARTVCRDEQYKNKAIVFYSLDKYSKLLLAAEHYNVRSPKSRQVQKDFKKLFALFTKIMLSESYSHELPEEKSVEFIPFDSNVTCSYCRCNIFNRFLTCTHCVGKFVNGEDDCYDVCMECYAMGRSCACISSLQWVEQFRWPELVQKHELWGKQICRLQNQKEDNYTSLNEERQHLGYRTLAEVCQRESKRRPWVDITKPTLNEKEGVDNQDDEDDQPSGDERPVKRRKVHPKDKSPKDHARCHICKTLEPTWKLASCRKCGLNYCYGSLFRAFEIKPQVPMQTYRWDCPRCQKICSCGACRRKFTTQPYEPKGLALGHDTRKIADPRSVEALVNFSHSNIGWLKKTGDGTADSTRRLQRHQEEAEKAKMHDAFAVQDDDGEYGQSMHTAPDLAYGGIPIDPALGGMADPMSNGFNIYDPSIHLPELAARVHQLSQSNAEHLLHRSEEETLRDAAAIRFEFPSENGFPPSAAIDITQDTNNDFNSFAIDPSLLTTPNNGADHGAISHLENGGPHNGTLHPQKQGGLVRLRLGRERMETLARSLKAFVRGASGTQSSLTGAPIVVSDLSFHKQSMPTPENTKKKRRRGEKDDDFKGGRRDRRKQRTPETDQNADKPKRVTRVNYFEDYSDAELSDGR